MLPLILRGLSLSYWRSFRRLHAVGVAVDAALDVSPARVLFAFQCPMREKNVALKVSLKINETSLKQQPVHSGAIPAAGISRIYVVTGHIK